VVVLSSERKSDQPWAKFHGKRVLLLQGPMGPFFWRVAEQLRQNGAHVCKVNFNIADSLYFQPAAETFLFRGTLEQWPGYLESLIARRSISTLMLFGDCRTYHRTAVNCASELGLDVYVFEEGYLRPNFITIERYGVNGNSRLPRDPEFYRNLSPQRAEAAPPASSSYAWGVLHSIVYACILTLFHWVTPRYRHHRDLNCVRQGLLWVRGGVRRMLHSTRDGKAADWLENGTKPPFFFVPLQVHCDSQISHSKFQDISEFIESVVRSFAQHAPASTYLVLKEHPLDRTYRDYSTLLKELGVKYGVSARLVYVDIVNLPKVLRNARGTIVINSTVGLSSLIHLTPTICLGRAIYDIEGLTHRGSLDDFWKQPGAVDAALLERFVYWVRKETQLTGSIWTDFNH